MKRLILIAAIASTNAFATDLNWQNSPYNWKNSDLNYNNSSMKYDNSPYAWKNNDLNYNQRNGVYDPYGNQVGYEVRRPDGVTNYFDNDGYRMGYSDE